MTDNIIQFAKSGEPTPADGDGEEPEGEPIAGLTIMEDGGINVWFTPVISPGAFEVMVKAMRDILYREGDE